MLAMLLARNDGDAADPAGVSAAVSVPSVSDRHPRGGEVTAASLLSSPLERDKLVQSKLQFDLPIIRHLAGILNSQLSL